jgi:hypothetical protein
MAQHEEGNMLDAVTMAADALELARKIDARQKALSQIVMLMLATLARSAPRDDVDQLLAQLERIRDLTGPAGIAAGEVIATAVSTLERAAKR